jgi:hypothetical protein
MRANRCAAMQPYDSIWGTLSDLLDSVDKQAYVCCVRS